MTISSTTTKVSFAGNASTTVFAYSFKIFETTDLEVIIRIAATGGETVKTLTTDYSVSGAGVDTGGNVTFGSAPASGETIVIRRKVPITQGTDYVENDTFTAESHESALDRLTTIAQQQQEEVDRTIKAPSTDTASLELPSSTARASRIMAFDASGGITTSAVDSLSLATLQAFTDYKVTTATGNGSTAIYTLVAEPGQEGNTQVFLDGVYQSKSSYSLAGAVLTFDTNIPSAVKIEVVHGTAASTFTPDNNSIGIEKIQTADIDTDLSSVSGSDDTLASAKAIKTYVDAQVDTVDTLAETLAIGNTSGGTDLAVSAGDDITFTDSSKAIFGAGGDLEIYHNGSNTYINETGTGKLIILATDLTMADTGNAHNYLNAVSGAGVTLYYDNNSKIATTATGVTITGEAIATGFTGTLDGILGSGSASAATVTALEVTSLSGTGAVTITDILDEDNMASNSATKLSTQQSIKAYVDAQVTASDLDFAGGTGTGAVDLDSQTFTVAGTANEIETAASGQTITVGLPANVTIAGVTTHGGNVVSDTDSTDSLGTTGVRWAGTWTDAINGVTAPTAQYTSAEETKLAGIETAADVTDSTNVLAGLVGQEAVATGFTGTLDGVLGGGTPASATVTTTQINGTATVGVDDTGYDVKFFGATSGSYMLWDESANNLVLGGGSTLVFDGDGLIDTTSGPLYLRTQAGSTIRIGDNTDANVQIGSGGGDTLMYNNAGIGIAPAARLHIKQAANGTSNGIRFERSDTTAHSVMYMGGDDDLYIQNQANGDINWYTNTAAAMTLKANGRLGIGTSAPATTLHCVGDATITDDLKLLSDSAILSFGADSEVTLTHVHDVGLAQPAGQTIYRGAAGDFDAAFTSRNNVHGQSDFEWGHLSGGYGNTLGSHVGSGGGFICFHGGKGSNSNTYQTHGQTGCGFQDNNNRILTFFSIDTADADNQTATTRITLNGTNGNLVVTGALSKGSGSFRIAHPLESKEDTHDLVHSFIEGPQADLIYRGRVTLSGGSATVNIDTSAGMTAGTFDVLCRDVQCFTSNESGWTCVRGSVSGATLTIEAEAPDCTDTISWMVVGERKDHHMIDTDWTDENGKVIVEPEKVAEEIVNIGE